MQKYKKWLNADVYCPKILKFACSNVMSSNSPVIIDIKKVLASKLGKRSRYVPRPLVWLIEKLICQKELNALLINNFPKRGPGSARVSSTTSM